MQILSLDHQILYQEFGAAEPFAIYFYHEWRERSCCTQKKSCLVAVEPTCILIFQHTLRLLLQMVTLLQQVLSGAQSLVTEHQGHGRFFRFQRGCLDSNYDIVSLCTTPELCIPARWKLWKEQFTITFRVSVCVPHICHKLRRNYVYHTGSIWYLYLSTSVFSPLALQFHESDESGRLSSEVWAEKGLCQHGLQVIWWPEDDAQAIAIANSWRDLTNHNGYHINQGYSNCWCYHWCCTLCSLSMSTIEVDPTSRSRLMTMNKKDPPSWLAISNMSLAKPLIGFPKHWRWSHGRSHR